MEREEERGSIGLGCMIKNHLKVFLCTFLPYTTKGISDERLMIVFYC